MSGWAETRRHREERACVEVAADVRVELSQAEDDYGLPGATGRWGRRGKTPP